MKRNIVSGSVSGFKTVTFELTGKNRIETVKWPGSRLNRFVTKQSVKALFFHPGIHKILMGGIYLEQKPTEVWNGIYENEILSIGCVQFDKVNTKKIKTWATRKKNAA